MALISEPKYRLGFSMEVRISKFFSIKDLVDNVAVVGVGVYNPQKFNYLTQIDKKANVKVD
jgi:hypothetical protein